MSRSVALILLVTLISVYCAECKEFLPGLLRAASTFTSETCAGKATACHTCNSIKICLAGVAEDADLTINCPSSTPYCNKDRSPTGGLCGALPDAECKEEFICTGVGHFPNPEACDSFYYCEESGKTGESYVCPTGYQYSSAKEECQRSVATCPKVVCDPQKIFVSYPQNSTFYVFCQYDKTSTTSRVKKMHILSCGSGSTFNVQTQICEFKCTREGLFASPSNPQEYIQCYLEGITWKSRVQTCSVGYKFDEKVSRCAKVTNASQPNPTAGVQNDYDADMNTVVDSAAPIASSNTGCIDFIANLLQNSRTIH